MIGYVGYSYSFLMLFISKAFNNIRLEGRSQLFVINSPNPLLS